MAFDAIAGAGFEYVGLMSAKAPGGRVISLDTTEEQAAQVAVEAKQRGLKIVCVYGGDFPVADSLEAGVAGLKKLVDNVAACDGERLMVGGTGDKGLYDRYYRAVRETCDYAQSKGVEIVLKPHGGLNATGPQCRKAIEQVGHKSFTLWYDAGNVLYYSKGGIDPVEDAKQVAGLVTGTCVKDCRIINNNGEKTGDVMVNPGEGQVRFGAVMRELRAGGLAGGPMLIETLATGDLPQLAAAASKAKLFVEWLVA